MYDRQQTNPAEEPGHGRGDEVFGRYVLLELLGRGAMGEVWKAKDAEHNREVALKFLWGSGLLSVRERERLRNEALTVIELHHKNIVRVYDYLSDPGGESAIVMEYVEGETLTQLLEMRPAGAMEVTEAESIVLGIAEALAEAHDHRPGVLHRDVKPDNIMVTKSGRVILMDFGLAETARETLLSRSVKAGVGLRSSGTPLYMSPQQQGGKKATEADDWYGLGATIYEVLTSRPPFFRGNIEHQIEKVDAPKMSERRKELGVSGESIPKEWERAVSEMLSKKPGGRKRAGRELMGMLQRKKVMGAPRGRSEGKGKGKLGIVMGSVVLLAVMGLGVAAVVGFQGLGGDVVETSIATERPVQEEEARLSEERKAAREADWKNALASYRRAMGEITGTAGRSLFKREDELIAAWEVLEKAAEEAGRYYVGLGADYPGKVQEETQEAWAGAVAREWEREASLFEEALSKDLEGVRAGWEERQERWAELRQGGKRLYASLEQSWREWDLEPGVEELAGKLERAEAAWLVSRMEGSEAGEERTIGGIELVWCPPGTFMMGSPGGEIGEEGRSDDEVQHEVTLTKGFWLAKKECTQGQWETVMGTDVAAQRDKANPERSLKGEGAEYPMYFVSWEEAQEWIAKMNEDHPPGEEWEWSLPTETQWEYACRAGGEHEGATAYGDTLSSEQANFDGNYPYGGASKGPYLERTAEVGSYKPNGWGLCDMHGNVWEWCRDWYGEYPMGAVTDPTGASGGSRRVFRGGSWGYFAASCRSAFRDGGTPGYRDDSLGFRPAVSSTR